MPFYLRIIEPVNVGRKQTIFTDATDDDQDNLVQSKEECANRTLTNLIRQLASLGRHADEIFGNIF